MRTDYTKQVMALTPAERRQVAIRERLKGMTAVEVVQLWYVAEEPFELTEEEDRIRQRWDFAKAQFLARKTYAKTVDAIMAEFSCSIAQARNDVRNMRHAFGNLDEVPKEVHRARAIEMALKAYKIAEKNEDGKSMAAATKIYIEATGVDKDSTDKVDIEKLMEQRVYVEALDPAVRNFLLNFLQNGGGSVDAASLFDKMYRAANGEFVDYEKVNDDETEQTSQPSETNDNA